MATLGEDLDAPTKIGYSFLCVALVLFAGLMSGLTLGLLSLDRVELEVRGAARARGGCAAARAAARVRATRHGAEWGRAVAARRCWCAAAPRSRSDKRPRSYRCGSAGARRGRGRRGGGEARAWQGLSV